MKKNIRKRSKKTIILLISIISAVVVTATALVLSVLLTKKSTEIEWSIDGVANCVLELFSIHRVIALV